MPTGPSADLRVTGTVSPGSDLGFDLAVEALGTERGCEIGPQHLDRDGAIDGHLGGFVDRCHAPGAEHADDLDESVVRDLAEHEGGFARDVEHASLVDEGRQQVGPMDLQVGGAEAGLGVRERVAPDQAAGGVHAQLHRLGREADGADGLERVRDGEWDLLILDVMLPGLSGFGKKK